MISYHAVMIDETGCEFGAEVWASDRTDARSQLRDMYPESRIAQVESRAESDEREHRMYAHILAGGDWDDDGRPIHHREDW